MARYTHKRYADNALIHRITAPSFFPIISENSKVESQNFPLLHLDAEADIALSASPGGKRDVPFSLVESAPQDVKPLPYLPQTPQALPSHRKSRPLDVNDCCVTDGNCRDN